MYRSFSDFVYEYQWPRSEFAPLRTGMSDEFRPDSAKFGKKDEVNEARKAVCAPQRRADRYRTASRSRNPQ